LAAVADTLRRRHPQLQIDTVVADLADRDAADRVGRQLASEHPETSLLINNAGVALFGTFDQVSLEDFNWVLDVNLRAVVTLTHHLLPVLRTHPGAHLANVSSVFGLIAPAGHAAYVASKFGVRGFTDALRHELAGELGVTCVHPGGVATQIAANARRGSGVTERHDTAGRKAFERLLTIRPEKAAEAILSGIERRRARVLIGYTATLPDLMVRVAPSSYGKVVGVLMNRGRRPAQTSVT
ncbi:MAG TPA: SDR family NAD(P)-dependent oxidoreductase, partial [Propionibacteriaceae bacterium]